MHIYCLENVFCISQKPVKIAVGWTPAGITNRKERYVLTIHNLISALLQRIHDEVAEMTARWTTAIASSLNSNSQAYFVVQTSILQYIYTSKYLNNTWCRKKQTKTSVVSPGCLHVGINMKISVFRCIAGASGDRMDLRHLNDEEERRDL